MNQEQKERIYRRIMAILIWSTLSMLLAAILLPIWGMRGESARREKRSRIHCVSNLKGIGLAFRIWSSENQGQFPFNVSTNAGGTQEFCSRDTNGFDSNGFVHLSFLSDLIHPKQLICLSDSSKREAADFQHLERENVTYQVRSGININETNRNEILVVCPIHGFTLFADGSVSQTTPTNGVRTDGVRH